jgi:nucleotide-binding universal stress UspA family protein
MNDTEAQAASAPAESAPTATIVVGYSAKPEGMAALRTAIVEARRRDARLIVVHTSPAEELAALTEELDSAGLPYEIRQAPDELDPADEVISAADSSKADFIVIGLRRRSPVGKLLLGSNAQRVLLDASCPVLAVKAEPIGRDS